MEGITKSINGYTWDYMKKFDGTDWNEAIQSIEDVKALLSWGWEFAAEYKGVTALLTRDVCGFYVDTEEDYVMFEDIHEFGEKATFCGDALKDVIGKWKIVMQQC